MTLTPAEHYQHADALLAELAEAKPEAFRFPFVQAKVARAQIHAQLAQSPWWPGLVDEPDYADFDDLDPGSQRHRITQLILGRHPIDTRKATGDRL
ncbi:hypothetical protein [Mycobacterium aquaticum]|uniref:Uncharacterized protein n=1 Tax=Mycobacterium aquaticum TaxID=1927124 RepID=A0A1X0B6W2_9MYCO|nr:hypothetical protein [Mycobacterium aquaticum]ORA38077.1 hypothetical protein BST13_05615 [Mycobacterium aquaticum]